MTSEELHLQSEVGWMNGQTIYCHTIIICHKRRLLNLNFLICHQIWMQFFCKMIILMGHEKILLFLKGTWYSNFTSKFETDFFQYYANKFPLPPSFHDKLSRKGPSSAKFQNLKCLVPLAKGHASVCHPSLTSTYKSPLNQVKPNLAVIVLGWYPFTIVLDSPALHSRWRPLLKIEISYASSGT